jgi:hypothetical protein
MMRAHVVSFVAPQGRFMNYSSNLGKSWLRGGSVSTAALVGALLWVNFLGGYTRPTTAGVSQARFLHYLCVHGTGIILIALSLRFLRNIGPLVKRNSAYWLIAPMAAICVSGTILGLSRGALPNENLLNALLPYAGSCLILLATRGEVRKRLVTIWKVQFAWSCAVVLHTVVVEIPNTELVVRSEWVTSREIVALHSLGLLPFFVGVCAGRRDWKLRLMTLLAWIFWIVLSLRGSMRGSLIVGCVVIPLGFLLVSLRGRETFQWVGFLLKCAMFTGVVTTAILTLEPGVRSSLRLDGAFSRTLWRFTGLTEWGEASEIRYGLQGRMIEHEQENSRGAEVIDFMRNVGLVEYAAGNGLGVPWHSRLYGEDRSMIHIGPFHLILRGGVPLLIAYYSLLVAALVSAWRNAKENPIAMGCFVFLCVHAVSFMSYGAQTSSYGTYVFWLIVGLALASRTARQTTTPIGSRSLEGGQWSAA